MQKSYDLTGMAGCYQDPEKTVQTIEISGLPLERNYWVGDVTHYASWNFAYVMRTLLTEILGLGDGPIEYPLGITANVLGNTRRDHVMRTVFIDFGPNDFSMPPQTHWLNHAGQIMHIA